MTTTTKPVYGGSVALTATHLLSLASDTNLLAGWSSAVIDNTSNLSVEEQITFAIKAGTSPTVGTTVCIYLWGIMDDTPTYPDTITGAEAAITLTSANVRDSGAFQLVDVITVDATSNRLYYSTISVSKWFGGHMPKKYGVFIAQNTGAALNAAGSVVTRIPLQYQQV